MPIFKKVLLKTKYNNWHDNIRRFNSEKHFENWYASASKVGNKIVGVENLVVTINCRVNMIPDLVFTTIMKAEEADTATLASIHRTDKGDYIEYTVTGQTFKILHKIDTLTKWNAKNEILPWKAPKQVVDNVLKSDIWNKINKN